MTQTQNEHRLSNTDKLKRWLQHTSDDKQDSKGKRPDSGKGAIVHVPFRVQQFAGKPPAAFRKLLSQR